MLSWVKLLLNSFLELAYPSLCLHCQQGLERHQPIFCNECLELLKLIDQNERCPFCFSADFNPISEKCCQSCHKNPPRTERIGAAFDYDGPAATLITHLKYGGQSYLAKGAAGFMATQFLNLNWPMPDVIIPMPMATLKRIERGYNQSALLAEVLGQILQCPVLNVLQRRSGDFSQAGLNHYQRLQLDSEGFSLKKGTKLYDKSILLVDDVMTTGSSMRCCAQVLQSALPKCIYGLTLCRAM